MRVPHILDMSRKPPVADLPDVQARDNRRERTMQRLQIGLTGIVLMILLVGLASIIQNRVAETDATTVPDAAPTTEPTQVAPRNDPLVEAGVVPDLAAEPAATPSAEPFPPPKVEGNAPPAGN